MVNEYYILKAILLAQENVRKGCGGPFGAIIVKDDKIIAQAVNTVTKDNDPTAHAEINAIRLACKVLKTFSLEGCVIYSSCEPCPMCLSAIYWARIDKIYYSANCIDAAQAGFDDSFIYKEMTLDIDKRKIVEERLCETEGKRPFELWQESKNKIEY
ncbi:MAG: nucleoside deaminase [Bacteroidales bacterium]|jgi:guanine deaminase|nr:nucleoside deaminase [Bacteroidales bacterium]